MLDEFHRNALDTAVSRCRFKNGGVVQDSDFFELLDEFGPKLHPRTQSLDWIVKVIAGELIIVRTHWGLR